MSLDAPIRLSDEFKILLDELENERGNFFITGRAGTGKSTLLRLFVKSSEKKCIVLAPTGIAALNAQGQTIHSFFKFPPRLLHRGMIRRKKNRDIYQNIDTLIIDEISMVRADLMDAMDYFLKINRNSNLPFGGVQLIVFGDLFQLPPIISSPEEREYFNHHYQSEYFFDAQVYRDLDFTVHELNTVYRQEQKFYLDLLDAIRKRELDHEQLEMLNERYFPDHPPFEDPYISLTATNASANSINFNQLAQMSGSSWIFSAKTKGSFPSHMEPTSQELALKPDAQIMTIKNDPNGKFVNGSIGKVLTCEPDKIKVFFPENGQEVDISYTEWEMIKYKWNPKESEIKAKVAGKFKQLPIKLAWAITIHKSQGKTFPAIYVDLGRGAFAHGQTYVALSRCTTFEGVALKQKLRPRDIFVDPRVTEFYRQEVVQ